MARLLSTLALFGSLAWLAIAPSLASADPPANDSFENPRTVPPGLGSNNSSYTAQPGEPAHAGVAANHSIWFRYTNSTAKDLTVQADTCNSVTDTVLSAYESAPDFASLVSLGEDDDGAAADPDCSAGDSRITLTAEAGKSYLFALDSKVAASPGSFQFGIRVQPANADFADAFALAGTAPVATGVNFFAGAEAGEPAHAGQPASNSVWYSFTPVGTGTVTVDACNTSLDTVLAVYTGNAVNALTPVASNDDAPGCGFGSDEGSRVEFAAVPGQTYMIALDGKTASEVGQFQIVVAGPPPNDMFAGASDLGSDTRAGDSWDTTHAGSEPSEPAILGDPAEHSVWYRWTAPQDGPVRIDTCESGYDTMLAVYTGTSLGALTEVASNDDSTVPPCDDGDSMVSFEAAEGQEYRIAIDGKAGATGFAQLVLLSKPLNDDFAGATLLEGTNGFDFGNTTLASEELGEPQHGGVGSGHSLWHSWTAPVGGIVEIETCSSDVDTVLAVYTGGAVGGLAPVASNDDSTGVTNCSEGDSRLSFGATAGTTYRIAVDSVSGEGRTEISLVRPADTTPPDTAIVSGPSGTITTPAAAFTYSGSPGFDVASFQCSLDGGPFESCPASGRGFDGLSFGDHTFSVRAIDFDGNIDPTPAARGFTVADPQEPPADCGAEERKLAGAKAKLKRAKGKAEDADGRRAVAKAKAKVRKARAKVKKAKAALAACE